MLNMSPMSNKLPSLLLVLVIKFHPLTLKKGCVSLLENGDNWSVGQRQLDEATASVCTIAHRIPTVIDNDMVLVLSDGLVADFDTPTRLLEDKSSMFLKLVTECSSRSSGIPDF